MSCCSNLKAYFPQASLLIAALVVLMLFLGDTADYVLGAIAIAIAGTLAFVQFSQPESKTVAKTEPPKSEQPSKPAAAVDVSGSAEAEVIAFLALLQEKGRLIDFLMDDIAQYDDAQVGTAARVVYQGCKAALLDHMKVEPLHSEAEGAQVTVPQGYKVSQYKLTGSLSGEAPFTGTLVHKGWKVDSIKLPKVVVDEGELPPLAPAQVEV